MDNTEANRIFYEVVNNNFVCRDDFTDIHIQIDGVKAYAEAICNRPLSDAKKKAIENEFYAKAEMELCLF